MSGTDEVMALFFLTVGSGLIGAAAGVASGSQTVGLLLGFGVYCIVGAILGTLIAVWGKEKHANG